MVSSLRSADFYKTTRDIKMYKLVNAAMFYAPWLERPLQKGDSVAEVQSSAELFEEIPDETTEVPQVENNNTPETQPEPVQEPEPEQTPEPEPETQPDKNKTNKQTKRGK